VTFSSSKTSKHALLIGVFVLCVGAAIVVPVALAHPSHVHRSARPHSSMHKSHAQSRAATTASVPSTVPSALQNAFVAFQRPSTQSDALPSNVDTASLQQQGINPSLSRLVVSTQSLQMWMVPGSTTSCLVSTTGLGGCDLNDDIVNRGLVGGVVGGNGQMWFGVLPTGARDITVTGNGQTSPVSLNNNAGFVQPVINQGLTYTAADGTKVSLADGAPTGPTAPVCPQSSASCS
jgi:hypothetical protein